MISATLRRRRVPIAGALLLFAVWLLGGLVRVEPGGGTAVLDLPLLGRGGRIVDPGWHLAPPGLLRLSRYPTEGATLSFAAGGGDAPLVSREGIEVEARGTLHYRVVPDRALDVHRSLGPDFAATALEPWVLEGLRAAIGAATYSDISGAHAQALGEALGGTLIERLRAAGLELLACSVSEVRIRAEEGRGADASGRPPGLKVALVGLDGADWNLIDPLLEQGRMPHLARLVRGGVRARLHSITPMLSPVVWTSVATGTLPARHGIIDFLASTGRDGERVPVTSSLRRVKALWNILSDAGLRVGVVGWWASFPPEPVNGFVVSDRVAYQLFGAHVAREPVGDGKVHPAAIADLVQSLVVAPETVGAAEVRRFIPLPDEPEGLPPGDAKLIEDFRTLLAAGDTYARIAEALARRHRPDFLAVYIESTDTVAHLFMPHRHPPLPGIDPGAARRFGRAVDEYYEHADELLGRILASLDPGTVVIVCSDHGFRTGENRPLTESRIGAGAAADWHRKYGILVLAGAPFRRGHELAEASVVDLAPTILALFGLPVAEDMDGRPITGAFDPAFLRAHPLRYTATYEGPAGAAAARAAAAATPAADAPGDADLKERLRSLGYLAQDTANSHNNRGIVLLSQGRPREAIAEFEQAIGAAEDLGIARLNIARARVRLRDYDGAVRALREHLERQPRSKEAESLLGHIAMERGSMDKAEGHFRRALEYEPNFTDARNGLGLLEQRRGRLDAAEAEFRRVVAIDPDYAEAHNNLGLIARDRGRAAESAGHFRRAIAADPEFAGAYSNLALWHEGRGELVEAEAQFRQAVRRDPQSAAVRANYGGLLYALGRLDRAREELERAVALDPAYPSAHNNLGAVYGRLGRTEDEIASYRRAAELDPAYADARHNLGLALLKQGRTAEGEAEMERTLALDPRYAPAYLNLGRSLLGSGRTRETVALLERGAGALPSDADVAALLGEALARAGERERAARALGRSLAIRPDQPELRRRLEEIGGVAVPAPSAPAPAAEPSTSPAAPP